MTVSLDELASRYPRLYHMAAAGSWPGIRRHGLLSTTALLDLFEVNGELRTSLESAHRPECVSISHPTHGDAVIRDQKPMDEVGLRRALPGDVSPREWFEILNEKVFFWVAEKRLKTMREARAYREIRQTIITIDTRSLLSAHWSNVVLCPMNSGCTKPFPHPRDRDIFRTPDDYPFQNRLRARKEGVVELAVRGGVPDVAEFILSVEENGGGKPTRTLYTR